ncbi:MAG: glycogen-binding domain-containing protein [Gemmatimonadales bacterium]
MSRALAVAAALVLRAGALAALQLGGTVDLGAGQAAWDQAGSGGALTQGALAASYRAGTLFGLEPELLGGAGLSSDPAERTAVQWDLGGRLHTRGAGTGAWLGASVGGAGVGSPTSRLTRLEGGLRQAIGPAGLHVWMSRTSFGAGTLGSKELGQGDTLALADTISRPGSTSGRRIAEYTDLGTRATVGLGSYELGVSFVRRVGGTGVRRTAWEANGVWWVAPSIGLVGAAGHSLPQFGLAVPGARYGTLGIRLALGAAPRGSRRVPREPPASAATAPRLVLARTDRLAIVGPPAGHAEVMGDFTDWQPRPLEPDGEGRWTLPVSLSPGVHHLNVRFDGAEWTVPAGAVAVDDGFGGRVGLFVVR